MVEAARRLRPSEAMVAREDHRHRSSRAMVAAAHLHRRLVATVAKEDRHRPSSRAMVAAVRRHLRLVAMDAVARQRRRKNPSSVVIPSEARNPWSLYRAARDSSLRSE